MGSKPGGTPPLLTRLKPASIAALAPAPESQFMVLNAPCLIERSRMGEFAAIAETVADEQTDLMRLTLLGPMPPYNFLDVEMATGRSRHRLA